MSFDNWTKLLEVLVSFLQGISWPLIVLFTIITLRVPFKKLLQDKDVRNLSFKAGPTGFEATIQRQQQQQVEAAALLGAATVSEVSEASSYARRLGKDKVKGLVYVVSGTDALLMAQLLAKTSVLWVTNSPEEEDMYAKRALDAIGMRVTSVSTREAMQKLKAEKYDVIILVIQKGSEYNQEFFRFWNEIREQYGTIQIITYSTVDLSDFSRLSSELRRNGTYIETDPITLFERIIEPVRRAYLQQLGGGSGVEPTQATRSSGITRNVKP